MDTEMTASAVIMGEGRMTEQEAIKAIKNNWPDERYSSLREALSLAIQALKNEEHRKELISFIENTWDKNQLYKSSARSYIELLKKCEVSDG
jgi:hypothetical protein